MWWIKSPQRLKSEVAAIEALQQRVPWLSPIIPRMLKGLKFAVDFDIVVNGEGFPFTLEYPAFFPETPPTVRPRDHRRLSSHQYGAGGEMCLEFRSDNWDPSVTGAMMIESTHRLISGEHPSPQEERAAVPTAHQTSLGQRLRGMSCRFFLTRGLRDFVATLKPNECRPCSIIETLGPRKTWTAHVATVGSTEQPEWQETAIPPRGGKGEAAILLRVSSLAELQIPDHVSLQNLIDGAVGSATLPVDDKALSRFTIVADSDAARLYFSFFHEGMWKLIAYTVIDLIDGRSRLPDSYAVLPGKKVGLLGCGSLGSKIAMSLARSGVGTFVLVDDDIFKPENLVRHDLDAASLGAHKVDGLEVRLRAVSAHIKVDVHRVILGGQEASGTTATVLDDLATCDVLIDATADPQAFNFVASVARNVLRPMVWAEVYAGGIGGFVARLRPGYEPPPHIARRQFIGWCREKGIPWEGEGVDYDARRVGTQPLVADDADVTVIAGHAARIALDVLVRPDDSAFTHPAYVIGLSKEWIFEEPFQTHPVDFVAEGEWQIAAPETQAAEAIDYVLSLLEQGDDADRTGS
jgi:hypothetical protein